MRKKKKEAERYVPIAKLMERICRDKFQKKIELSFVIGHSEENFIKDRVFEPMDNPAEMIALSLFQVNYDFNPIFKEKLLLLCEENDIDFDAVENHLHMLMNLYAFLAIKQHEQNLSSLN